MWALCSRDGVPQGGHLFCDDVLNFLENAVQLIDTRSKEAVVAFWVVLSEFLYQRMELPHCSLRSRTRRTYSLRRYRS